MKYWQWSFDRVACPRPSDEGACIRKEAMECKDEATKGETISKPVLPSWQGSARDRLGLVDLVVFARCWILAACAEVVDCQTCQSDTSFIVTTRDFVNKWPDCVPSEQPEYTWMSKALTWVVRMVGMLRNGVYKEAKPGNCNRSVSSALCSVLLTHLSLGILSKGEAQSNQLPDR